MDDLKCPDCGCTTINDYGCEVCEVRQQDEDGNDCEVCNGDGYVPGVMECNDCGMVDDACAFEDTGQ